MHIFRHKFISIFICSGSGKLSLKSDQLEVSGSVHSDKSHRVSKGLQTGGISVYFRKELKNEIATFDYILRSFSVTFKHSNEV